MFNLNVNLWQLNNPNHLEIFQNAFVMREKQFKVWWTPFYPRANLVHHIRNTITDLFGMPRDDKKYFL